jgi:hypothetical protein
MRLRERADRPALGLQPRRVPFCPRLLREREAAPVAQEKFREAMPRAQQIGANVLTAAQ